MINVVTFPGLGLEFTLDRVPSTYLDGRSSGTASSSPPGCCWRSTSAPGGPRGSASYPTTSWT